MECFNLYTKCAYISYDIYTLAFPLILGMKVLHVIVITQDEYDIFVITQVRGKAEDEC